MNDTVFILKFPTGELHSVKATEEAAEVIAAKFELTVEKYVPERKVMSDNTAFTVSKHFTAFLPSNGCPLKADYKPHVCGKPTKHVFSKDGTTLHVCGIHRETLRSEGWKVQA